MAKAFCRDVTCASAVAAVLAGANAVQVHAAENDQLNEVVVTGSRIITDGFAAPTPVTVITAEQMQATAPNSLSDALNQLPQLKLSYTPATTGFAATATAGNGGSFANLRGLNPKRVLVLLDGKRVVQSQANGGVAGAVDLNILPQSLVRSVDVVTGGASAAYGSDALTGVINFALDTKLTGLKGEVRGGRTRYGDNQNYDGSLAFGNAFADGRGHLIASIEYYHTDGIFDYSERPFANGVATISNCPVPQTSVSCPSRIITGPIKPSNLSSGGLITGGATALRGQTFVGNGSVTAFPFGQLRNTTTMVGGGIDEEQGQYYNFVPESTRRSGYLRTEYALQEDWTVHADLLYGDARNHFHGLPSYTGLTGAFTLFADNPYLPASVVAQMGGAGATSALLYNPATGLFNGPRVNTITIGRLNLDFPAQDSYTDTSTLRFEAGIDGKVGQWILGAYYEHGAAKNENVNYGFSVLTNLFSALDVVRSPGGTGLPAAGAPICRSTLTTPTNGCVPLNVVGQGTATPESIAYINGATTPNFLVQKLKQDVLEITGRSEPFSTWAGPVALGVGAAYRRESLDGVADELGTLYNPALPGTSAYKAGLTPALTINGFPSTKQGTQGIWHTNNNIGSTGSLDVREVFAETLLPLLRDKPFAKQIDLNAAVRYADYQYGGGQTNWKLGLVYMPFEDLRLRSTQSRDIRAPNLADLFAGRSVTLAGVTDPFRTGTTGVPENANFGNTISQGNIDLAPEVGDTFTVGAVYSPSWVEGLTVSVDYYHIKISDAIAQAGGQVIVNQCFDGNQPFCDLITRNTNPTTFGAGNTVGPITALYNPVLNIGTTINAGFDFEVGYRLALGNLFAGRGDSLTFRLLGTRLIKNSSIVVGATTVTEQVGINGGGIIQGTGGTTDWTSTLNVTYRNGPLMVNLQERFINGGKINAQVDEAGNPNPANAAVNANTSQNGLVPNTVPAYFYTDLSANYSFGPNQKMQAFLTVNNLFDKSPPQELGALFGVGVVPTNYSVYDAIGRAFTLGARFRF
jgi:outer membrane receptor protein involved in Fe transport